MVKSISQTYKMGNKESTKVNAQVKSSSSSKAAAIKMAHHQPQIIKPVTHSKHKSPTQLQASSIKHKTTKPTKPQQ